MRGLIKSKHNTDPGITSQVQREEVEMKKARAPFHSLVFLSFRSSSHCKSNDSEVKGTK